MAEYTNPGEALMRANGLTASYGSPDYWKEYDTWNDRMSGMGDGGFAGANTWQSDPNRHKGMNEYLGNQDNFPNLANQLIASGQGTTGVDVSAQANAARAQQQLYGNDLLGTMLYGQLPTNSGGGAATKAPPSLDMNNGGKDQLSNWLKTAGAGAQFDGLAAFTGSYNPFGAGEDANLNTNALAAGYQGKANLNPLLQAAAQTGYDVSNYNLNDKDPNNQIQKLYEDMNKALSGYHTVHTLSSNYGDNSRGERGNANILYKDNGSGVWDPMYVGKQSTEREKGNWFQENPDFVGVISTLLPAVGGWAGLANMAGAGLSGATAAGVNALGSAAMGAATGGEKGALAGLLGGATPILNDYLSGLGMPSTLAQGAGGAISGGLKGMLSGQGAGAGALMGGISGAAQGAGKDLGFDKGLGGMFGQVAGNVANSYLQNQQQEKAQQQQQQVVQSIYSEGAQRGYSQDQINRFLQTPQGRSALQAMVSKGGSLQSLFG